MAKRLWDKGLDSDKQIHTFTVGNDFEIDLKLARWDAIASAAHAKILIKNKIITSEECKNLLRELKQIAADSDQNKFLIAPELEDCHTAIEVSLVNKLGDLGKKIHTGRSRNDQVLVAMRLFLKNSVFETSEHLLELAEAFSSRYRKDRNIPLPGYTHFQPAMPSSIGMWSHSYLEWCLELLKSGQDLLNQIDSCPLGAASGFGVPLNLYRKESAQLLGFQRVQRNPVNVQNSRGREELKLLRWFLDCGSLVEKFACDLMLYTTSEYDFISLPDSFTTGSSIMPQKRNPDVIELLRARCSKLKGAHEELFSLIAKLPSSYHRDFQYSKEPVMKAAANLTEMLAVTTAVVRAFKCKEEKLRNAMSDDLYITYHVYSQVREGISFRDAYQKTAKLIGSPQLKLEDLKNDFKIIAEQIDAEFNEAEEERIYLENKIEKLFSAFSKMQEAVFQ